MVIEKVLIPEDEKSILKQTIGKEISKIQTSDFTDFYSDTIWIICLDLYDSYLSIERKDMVAMLFDAPEDGGKFKLSKIDDVSMYSKYFKTINRVVRGVSIAMNHVQYEISQYNLTYTKLQEKYREIIKKDPSIEKIGRGSFFCSESIIEIID